MAILIKRIRETVNISDDTVVRVVPYLAPEFDLFRRSQVGFAGMMIAAPGYFVERREYTLHELIFTMEGAGAVTSEDCVSDLDSGGLLVLPARTSYRYECGRAPWRFIWFQLSNSGPWRSLSGMPIHTRRSHVAGDLESAFLRLLNESVALEPNASCLTTLLSEQVLLYLERELALSESPQQLGMRQRIDGIWRLVRQNLDKGWTTRRLAELGNMSESTFYRACLRHTGVNPHNMLLKMRMQQAEQLLRNSDYPAKMIAEIVGYSTPFAFSNAFKRYKKMSPKAYRAQVEREQMH